jgi:vancomycin aglycone glucosyltransferase
MRVLLSTWGSRGDVEPLAGLAVALQSFGVEAVVSAPPEPEFEELLARAGVPMAPAFCSVRDWIARAKASKAKLPELAAMMIPAQYEAIDAAADGCHAVVATGLLPSEAAAQCVAEKRGLHHVHVALCPMYLPSHHHQPFPRPGHPHPPEVTDPRALWDLNGEACNALFGDALNAQRASIGLTTVDNIRDHVFTDSPWLASDPVLWPWQPTGLCDPVQTGAWILPDTRPLPADLEAFLDAGSAPVHVGFGSIAVQAATDIAEAAIGAIRAQGRRVVLARGWAEMALVDALDDCFLVGEVNQQALFRRVAAVVHHGGAGTTTTAARAGAPQVIVPQIVDQPFWAERVTRLGIGQSHNGSVPTLDSLSAALEVALADEIRERAMVVAGTMRNDGAMLAARRLIDVIAGKGRRESTGSFRRARTRVGGGRK